MKETLNKIKEFILKNKIVVSIVALVLVVAIVAVAVISCGDNEKSDNNDKNQGNNGSSTGSYTIQIKAESGMAFEDIGVYVYTDSSKSDMVAFERTDADGKMSFTGNGSDAYVAVLEGIPEGYDLKEYYDITEENTEIVLKTVLLPLEDMANTKFELGDVIKDFSVTTPDGTTVTISELLQEKEAVVLNFWYLACNPCRNEFPYLQEAYTQYSDDVAVIAMTPVDNNDTEIAAFIEELGLTFYVAKCDAAWESVMDITAYPTTVVIDRNGIISLIHKGSVTETEIFTGIFEFFTADDYEQTVVEYVEDILDEDISTGNEDEEVTGTSEVDVTVKPGEEVEVEVYKVSGMYLEIKDADAYIMYNGEKYTPVDGAVGLVVTSSDTFTPVKFSVGNTGSDEKIFKATFSFVEGTMDAPYTMELGEFTAKVEAGNEQGVYYIFTATANGTLTVQCSDAGVGTSYDYTLYNLNTYANRTASGEGSSGASGATLSIEVNAGDKVQFSICSLPDANNEYPGGEYKLNVSFVQGEENEDTGTDEQIKYTVTVKDAAGKAISDVKVTVSGSNMMDVEAVTNTYGVAEFELAAGTYTAVVSVPSGYTADETDFTLTESKKDVTATISEATVAESTYTVKVVDANNKAISGVMVSVGSGFGTTDSKGSVSFTLPTDSYTAMIIPPSGYTADKSSYSFNGKTSLTITLKKESSSEGTTSTRPSEEETTTKNPSTGETTTKPTQGQTTTKPTQGQTTTKPTQGQTTTKPTEQETTTKPPVSNNITYTVNVVDYAGKGISGVAVKFMSNGSAVSMASTNASGKATASLTKGSYTVELAFTDTTMSYDHIDVSLTSSKTSVTITAAKKATDSESMWFDATDAYYIEVGGQYVEIPEKDMKRNDGKNAFFMFAPTKSGTYKISTSNSSAAISYWGASTFFISNGTSDIEHTSTSITLNVKDSNIGATYIIGVTGISDCVISVVRTGNAVLDENDIPWTDYTGTTHTPKKYSLGSGKKLTFVDVSKSSSTYKLVYNSADGYYHLGSANGPVMMVKLMTGAPYVAMSDVIGYTGAGGSNFGKYVYSGSTLIKKENYINILKDYMLCCDETYGVYPLTKDLEYMLKNGGEHMGWWDSTSESYIFSSVSGLNKDIAWMFACCYVE